MLEKFKNWILEHKDNIARQGLQVEIVDPSARFDLSAIDNKSIYIDFDAPDRIGRITLWESGDCDMEILDFHTGAIVEWEHYEITSFDELIRISKEYLKRLAG